LVIKSFARVLEVDPGIRTDHLLSMQITLPRARYDSAKSTMFYDELMQRLRGAPGVEAVATTSLVPLSGDFDRIGIAKIAGAADRAGSEAAEGDRYVVSPSYFATMGVRLVRGRSFEAGDLLSAPFVVLVDEVFARRIFGGMDPIGRRMQVTGGWATIVGVVTHVKTYGLDAASPGQIYISSQQYPWRWSALVIRASGDPMALEPVARRIVHELDPDQPIDDVATVEGYLRDSLRARKFTLELLGAFAAAALALAVIGLYGVIAYGVTLRRRELGIRIALGAQRAQIARRVLGDGALIALAGMAVGLVGALASGRAMSSLLFEVSPRDGVVFTLVCAVMLAVALAASFVPARRATLVDATEVLRGD
ncbi:MAG TPA: ABC transporter permease, partial [Gemmatimonadaceae bacterium]|nr:ABC transporter permease [Gemmatimonadaceae bacterium]